MSVIRIEVSHWCTLSLWTVIGRKWRFLEDERSPGGRKRQIGQLDGILAYVTRHTWVGEDAKRCRVVSSLEKPVTQSAYGTEWEDLLGGDIPRLEAMKTKKAIAW